MIEIIEKALKDLSGMQLNLESDIARTWIAQKVEKAITDNRKAIANETADYILKDINCNTTMEVDDVIVSAMETEGYIKGDSGYDFRSGKRDITFHAPNGNVYVVVFRKLNDD